VSKTRWTANIILGTSLALNACVQPPPTQSISGDGDYVGTATRSQYPQRRDCPHSGPFSLSVRAGVAYYRWSNQYIPVQVLSNGTLSGAVPGVQLTGTHDGTILQGNVTDGQCWLHFTLRRVGS
jgi:hypothetical protein